MVTDEQVRLLFTLVRKQGDSVMKGAAKAGMSASTARRHLRDGKVPSDRKQPRTWRTRKDPFAEAWEEVVGFLKINPDLEAKALFAELRRRHPGKFEPGQLRTLQRRVKHWKATEGPGREVFFEQVYAPGERAQSDFTCMNALGVTIGGAPFKHLLYHFVLPYSNWETGSVCRSESFEALSEGLQSALAACGGAPKLHQTDSMSCAVRKLKRGGRDDFTERCQALMRHCGMEARHTQVRSPHENGKIEQRHYRFKRAVRNRLILRGSGDFESRRAYDRFLAALFVELNMSRQARFAQEQARLRPLPKKRLASYKRIEARVTRGSTIRVRNNCYSVPSRLVGELVTVRIYAEAIEVWFGQRLMERMPRLHGRSRHRIEYRHVIGALIRKPGAFADYRYRADLFPTHRFRMAYDALRRTHKSALRADKVYLSVLHLAAREGQSGVESALDLLLGRRQTITLEVVEALLAQAAKPSRPAAEPFEVDMSRYDALLNPETMNAIARRHEDDNDR